MRQRVVKARGPRSKWPSFSRTRRGPGAGKAEARSKALAVKIRQILSQYYKQLVDEEIKRLKGVVRKAAPNPQRVIDALATVTANAGIREMQDAGQRMDSSYTVPPELYQQYFNEKRREQTMLIQNVTSEFQRKSREFVSGWLTEDPGLTHAELARRLRFSYFADGAEVLAPNQRPTRGVLEPLERGPPITRDVFSRASLIARTEMVQVQNAGAFSAMRAMGQRYKMWKPQLSQGGRGHQDMRDVVVPINEHFILPDGTPMMKPGDGPIKHVANCRCSVTARPRSRVLAEDKKRGINTAEADARAMFGSR